MTAYSRPSTSVTLTLAPAPECPNGAEMRYGAAAPLACTATHTIYTALDRQTEREVIVKQTYETDTQARLRLACEGAMLRFLGRQNVTAPRFVDFFEEHGRAHLAMTRIGGRTLEALHRADEISAVQIVLLVSQLCEQVMRLHLLGYVHHDIKPANIVVQPDCAPVLIDWGAATKYSSMSKPGGICTPDFASPEQVRGFARPTNDIFALGMTLHALIPRPAPRLNAIIDRAIRVRAPRYRSAEELGYDLAQLCIIDRLASYFALTAV